MNNKTMSKTKIFLFHNHNITKMNIQYNQEKYEDELL